MSDHREDTTFRKFCFPPIHSKMWGWRFQIYPLWRPLSNKLNFQVWKYQHSVDRRPKQWDRDAFSNVAGLLCISQREREWEKEGKWWCRYLLSSRPQTLSLSHHSTSIDPRTQWSPGTLALPPLHRINTSSITVYFLFLSVSSIWSNADEQIRLLVFSPHASSLFIHLSIHPSSNHTTF